MSLGGFAEVSLGGLYCKSKDRNGLAHTEL